MTTKKKANEKKSDQKAGQQPADKPIKTADKPKSELVGGRFKAGSDLARMYSLLADGKARSIDEIQAVVKATVKANIGVGKYVVLRKWGEESGQFTMSKEDGKIQMIMTAKAKTA